MNTDPILEELWKIKDSLARDAGYDVYRLGENVRRWAAEHPELMTPLVQDLAASRAAHEARIAKLPAPLTGEMLLREEPPDYGEKKD